MTGVDESSRRSAPAAGRNKEPILEVLRRVLPPSGLVLEIASGTGQHVAHFAAALPGLRWQPSDPDPAHLTSIRAWTDELPNVLEPLELDVRHRPWPIDRADAVICSNMIHIAPWAAAEALVAGSGELLSSGGALFLYGPFRRLGGHTTPSNEAFDAQLRVRDPEWGVRDLEAVEALANGAGFVLEEVVEMPANNLSVLLRKQAAARVRKHAFTGPATDAARPQALPTAIRKEPR
jgi:SAM-dependent methyltransferase